MNQINRGKDFEHEIQVALESVNGVSVDRLYDTMNGYKGVSNISDYIVFQSPDEFYIECKCLYGNTLNYKSKIRENQWEGLESKSKIYRCICGVCVWFIDYDITAFIKIQDLIEHRNKGAKSLNISDIVSTNSIPHILLDGKKRRALFTYDGRKFMYDLHNLSNLVWGGSNEVDKR